MNVSDRAVSYLRTVVPVLWGSVVAQVVAWLAGRIDGDVANAVADWLQSEAAVTAVTAAAIALWYVVWRRVEPHVPDWLTRIVLGSAKPPTYNEPGVDGDTSRRPYSTPL